MGNSHPNTPQTQKHPTRAKRAGRLAGSGATSSGGGGDGEKAAPTAVGSRRVAAGRNVPSSATAINNNNNISSNNNKKITLTTQRTKQQQPGSSNSSSIRDKSSNESSSRLLFLDNKEKKQRQIHSSGGQKTNNKSRQHQQQTSEQTKHRATATPDELKCSIKQQQQQLPPLVGPKVLPGDDANEMDKLYFNKDTPLSDKQTTNRVLAAAASQSPLPPVNEFSDELARSLSSANEAPNTATHSGAASSSRQVTTKPQQIGGRIARPKAILNRSSSLYVTTTTTKNMTYEQGSQLISGATGALPARFAPQARASPPFLVSRLYSAADSTIPFHRFALIEDQRQRVRHWLNTQPFDQVERWNKSEPGSQMESTSDITSEQSELSVVRSGVGGGSKTNLPDENVGQSSATSQICEQQEEDSRGDEEVEEDAEDADLMDRISVSATSTDAANEATGEVKDTSLSSVVKQQPEDEQQEQQPEDGSKAAAVVGGGGRPRSSSMQIIGSGGSFKTTTTTVEPLRAMANDDCSLCQYLESIKATVVDKQVLFSGGGGSGATAAAANDDKLLIGEQTSSKLQLSIDRGLAAKTAAAIGATENVLGRRELDARLQIRRLNWQSSKTTSGTFDDEPFSLQSASGDEKACRDSNLRDSQAAAAAAASTSAESTIAEAANYPSKHQQHHHEPSSTDGGCNRDDKAAAKTARSSDAGKQDSSDTIVSLEMKQQLDERELKITNSNSSRRRLKIMRGYSLDHTKSNINNISNSNTRVIHKTGITSGGALKRTRSNLSQSRRLIVINAENASYTIQVETETDTEPSNCIVDPAHGDSIDKLVEQSSSNIGANNHHYHNNNQHQHQQPQRQVAKYILRKQRVDKFQSQRTHRATQSFDERGCINNNQSITTATAAAATTDTTITGFVYSTATPPATYRNSYTSAGYKNTKELSTSLNLSKFHPTHRGQQDYRETCDTSIATNRRQSCVREETYNQPAIFQLAMMHDIQTAQAGVSNKSDETSSQSNEPKKAHSISDNNDRSVGLKQAAKKSLGSDPGADHRSIMDMVTLNFQATQGGDPTHASNYNDETAKSCNIAARRLRDLAAHLEHGSVPQSVLYQTLEYAAAVLDTVTMDQISRVSDEEDGDLSEVQSDAVPNEVRKWLETTFTRNSISQKRKSEDKLKFRSVANAIRAGIVVDRIYRRTSASIPFVSAEVSGLLKSIDDWSFDCFAVNQVSAGQVLKSVGYELFNRYGLMYKFKIPTTTLKNFLTQIESGYTKHKNPYHNNLHAADVTQTVHYMLWQAGLTNWLTDLEIFATLLAAIIHDYLHTGTTNNFHVMSQSETALIYNDRAVLENFHICQAFTLMRNEDCNILAGLTKDEYREFRSLVIDMVLATDMSSHFQQIKAMKNILNHSDNFNADKSKILSLVIHISDISHPAKQWELHSQWTQLLMEEFFRQGDREKDLDLECSPLCDRETTLVAESQLGFIEFIVSPSLEVCGDVLDRVHYQMAEANARPVLPASAKAASVVAASASSINKQKEIKPAAIEPPPTPVVASKANSTSSTGSVSSGGGSASGLASLGSNSSTGNAVAAAPCSSFVSSETLTSNLRKMIVSSSATIGRKLNISGGSSSASGQPALSTTAVATSRSSANKPSLSATDFETRQANYKHPVIQQEGSMRPKSSDPRVRQQQQASGDTATASQQDNRTLATDLAVANRFNQSNIEQVTPRCASSALASHHPPHHFKIKRPWIACLERNKKIWHERSITDAHARELKEKMKQQQQIQEVNPKDVEQKSEQQ